MYIYLFIYFIPPPCAFLDTPISYCWKSYSYS
ncbi:hypothetical protein PFUGPA_02316 [Plasmodium falciparum Palo Alto/Uganda]|uniref:Uncharacterized protein n=1 Tax=Plasmodium falciparum (isolate Palo Alto / Uganda) TaxID=57270 RepID=W4J1N2_PLAFP|nr:hypothetical protein PFUGPA_02316 [Plasmodium falciparum Palo Alto/Uganda]